MDTISENGTQPLPGGSTLQGIENQKYLPGFPEQVFFFRFFL